MLNYDLKFITCDESVNVKNVDFKTSKYETKKKSEESVYDQAKRSFCERRGGQWRAPRPRILREFENKLRDRTVVFCEWMSDNIVTVIFSSGSIAYLTLNSNGLDIVQILFDRYCVGKLSGQSITGVVFSTTHLLFTHTESTATLISFSKNSTRGVPYRIVDRNPFLQSIELADGARRAERKMSWGEAVHNAPSGSSSVSGPRVLIWTAAGADPAPWTPAAEIRANLYLYQLKGHQMNVIAFHHLENETLSAEVSRLQHNMVHIVEQVTCHKSGITLTWHRYNVPTQEEGVVRLTAHRTSETSVFLPAVGRIVCRSPCDRRLLVACIDGSMHVVHVVSGLTHSSRTGFIPTEIQWSRDMVICAEEGARLQVFDRALTLMQNNAKCIHLAHHFRESPHNMRILSVSSIKGGALLLILFSGGPLALLRVIHPQLPAAWIRCGRLSRAVAWLRAMDWEYESEHCLRALHAISNEIRRSPLNSGGEAALQAALGTALAPPSPSPSPSPSPHSPHTPHSPPTPPHSPRRPAVAALARCFFHMLLRRSRINKSLSLAVSIGSWDLFSDAHWSSLNQGRTDLAEEARELALYYQQMEIEQDSECSSSCSCSSECSSPRPPAPPLPRVPPPGHAPRPALVPIHQSEPVAQTHAIRPNLHQYLERDLSIWNTDLKTWREREKIDVKMDQMDLRDIGFQHRYKVDSRRGEKNVKFSDTVTIAVLAEPRQPEPARELAESLPLCAPHAYLAAFEPAAAATATAAATAAAAASVAASAGTADYVEV